MTRLLFVCLLIVSLFEVHMKADKNRPVYPLLAMNDSVEWDEEEEVWIDRNVYLDLWVFQETNKEIRDRVISHYKQPLRTPVHKTVIITLRYNIFTRPEIGTALGATVMLKTKRQRRLVLVNVDNSPANEDQYRIWPHLGLLYVGTAAYEEGWDVILWDELIQGHAKLDELVQPGDIVGFSLVVSFTERGVELARQAKQLGARYVIAGNDAAIFRASQLLALSDKPIDAVFTSNSTNAVRQFFREIGNKDISEISIPEVATSPERAILHSNDSTTLTLELKQRKEQLHEALEPPDGFLIPRFELYDTAYWEQVWKTYRSQYGHKHANPAAMKGAIINLAQGCTRTQGKEACSYCTIFGVADVRVPKELYLTKLLERYEAFGLNNLYNITDSAFEMMPLVKRLQAIGFKTGSLEIYGRALGLAEHRKLLDTWLSFVDERLLINCGMDSGDEQMLQRGIVKAHRGSGSRLNENRQAILNLKGSGAHLYYSVILGSPGETRESCQRTLDFIRWSLGELGTQLDLVEADIYWLNFGSASSRVFYDFEYAQQLAAITGKSITREQWHHDFAQHANALNVPWSVEQAWYHWFTQIDVETAYEFQAQVRQLTSQHPDHITPRDYAFKPPEDKA